MRNRKILEKNVRKIELQDEINFIYGFKDFLSVKLLMLFVIFVEK